MSFSAGSPLVASFLFILWCLLPCVFVLTVFEATSPLWFLPWLFCSGCCSVFLTPFATGSPPLWHLSLLFFSSYWMVFFFSLPRFVQSTLRFLGVLQSVLPLLGSLYWIRMGLDFFPHVWMCTGQYYVHQRPSDARFPHCTVLWTKLPDSEIGALLRQEYYHPSPNLNNTSLTQTYDSFSYHIKRINNRKHLEVTQRIIRYNIL